MMTESPEQRRPGRPRGRWRGAPKPRSTATRHTATTVTFTADELTALARYVSTGMVLLQTRHPVLSKIKSGMSRLDLTPPLGL